ncbi:MarR family winged helix-turn-helix transcriptional regulator [Leptospira sp. 'Mane']|uniref:MarR family winged helix-turn-helix transcriptional regulator n=1 Tax=Leptospira sp. 'Mane' TaxID=3387407 RepID=UPI00398B8A78
MKKNSKKRFHSVKYLERLSDFLTETVEGELKKLGFPSLSASHFEIITYLLRKKTACNMSKIAEEIHRTKPTVTVLITKLESLNLIKKEISPLDKREIMVSLTKEGKAFQAPAREITVKIFSLKLWGLNPEESAQLYGLLEKTYNYTYQNRFDR